MLVAGDEQGLCAVVRVSQRRLDAGSVSAGTLSFMDGAVGWLSEYSEPALRSALRVAGAGLDQLPIELTGHERPDPFHVASGSATIDGGFLVKFAFSGPVAVRVWHEARVLKLLGEQPGSDVPDVVVAVRPPPAWPLGSLRVGCRSPMT